MYICRYVDIRYVYMYMCRYVYADFVMHDLMHDARSSNIHWWRILFQSRWTGKETKIYRKTCHLSFARFNDPVSEIEVFDTV